MEARTVRRGEPSVGARPTRMGGSMSACSLPGFIGIGAMKAGTTLLYELLRQHPDLQMAYGRKEVHFFDRHYDRGLSWYRSLFDDDREQLGGEITPNYLYDRRCPERIHEHVSDARLIVCLRDPVARAYSQFTQWVRDAAYREDLPQFLDEHPNAVERGLYFEQLSRYLSLFPRDRPHVVIFEDFVADPLGQFDAICTFLGVPRFAEVRLPSGRVNATVRPRHGRAYAAAKKARAALYRRNVVWPVEAARRVGAVPVLLRPDRRVGFPPLPASTSRHLREVYRPDVEQLSRLLGRDLVSLWGMDGEESAGSGAVRTVDLPANNR